MMSQYLFCCFAFKSHHIWKFCTMESEKQQFEEMHMPHLLILLNACVRLNYQPGHHPPWSDFGCTIILSTEENELLFQIQSFSLVWILFSPE